MSNLSAKLLEPSWVAEQQSEDNSMTYRKSYYLPGNSIKDDVKCRASVCKWETRHAKGREATEENTLLGETSLIPKCQPMMICFSCNRTYHLMCLDLCMKWMEQTLPIRCPECRDQCSNLYATEFFKSGKWKGGMRVRKKAFLKPESIDSNPDLLEVHSDDDGMEKEDEKLLESTMLDSSAFITAAYATQHQKEMDLLGNEMEKILAEKLKLEEEVKGLKADKTKQKDDSNHTMPSFATPQSTMREPPVNLTSASDILSRVYANMSKKKANSEKKEEPKANASQKTNDTSGAGLTQPDNSFLNGVNLSTLDPTLRVMLEQTFVQREASNAQRDVSQAMKLEQQRKSLQKIAAFNGDERDWIRFKRDITRHQEIGQYDEASMKLYLLRALEGIALDRVRDLVDRVSLADTMRVLEETFGDPTRIINKRGEDILALRLSTKDLYKDDVVVIVTKLQAYFAACSYANVEVANSNHLAMHIFNQLNIDHRQRCRRFHREENGNNINQLLDLETLFKFLEMLMKDLDDKKAKPAQVNATAYSPHSSNPNSAPKNDARPDRYQVRDLSEAKFMGYDLSKVNSLEKKCLICHKNHFTVECKAYYEMDKEKRNKIVTEKGLCRNCLLTTSHKHQDCVMKPHCGLFANGSRCNGKHHVSLHKSDNRRPFNNGFRRRNYTNYNLQRASGIQSTHNNNQTPNQTSQSGAPAPTAPPLSTLNRMQNALRGQRQENSLTAAPISVIPYSNNSINSVNAAALTQGSTVKVFKTKFYGKNGYVFGHTVGDSASETTFLTEELRQALELEGEKCQMSVRWADATVKTIDAIRVDLELRGVHKNAKNLTLKGCYAVKSEDFSLPARSLDMKWLKREYPYLKPVKCDSYFDKQPYLLIGSPHASVIESCGQLYEGGEGKPVGLLAKLGWCVYGGSPEEMHDNFVGNVQYEPDVSRNDTSMSNAELYEAFSFFNSIENLGIKEKSSRHTEDEAKALAIMEEELRILPNGTIEVPLVWNRHDGQIPKLPDNLPMVLKRQLAHETKLLKNAEHHRVYNEKFKELLTEGYVRAATIEELSQEWPNINYLPMTLVINQNKVPVGYRIVFDAAAKYLQTSLNTHLLKGPDLLVNLYEPLMRMRTKQVAFTADIKAMFMRMKVCQRDQQCQRVLFRESPNDELRIFIVSSVLFGPSCSPFQSQYCKNLIAKAWQDLNPEASHAIENFMYMDDLLTSESTTDKAVAVASQCIDMFAAVNWHLVSFQNNDLEFLKRLPTGSVKQETIPLMEDVNALRATKVLGCCWDTRNDNFIFNFDKNLFIKIVKECQHKPTKRDQSSTIARIFDVMGFLSHLVIRGRILLQRSWQNGIDWDQTISDGEHKQWLEWLNEIESAAAIKIPRKLCGGPDLWESQETSLHCFCDAGAEAYAAVAYLVTKYDGKRSASIVMARAKVTPLRYKSKTKVTEIPRLELFSALCAARLCHMIAKCFPGLKFNRYLWSDSEVVLRWIKNKNKQLKAYAVSPVEEILSKTDTQEWKYVPTKLNVADIATKFKKFDFSDSNSIWFKGPEFILSNQDSWPEQPDLLTKQSDDGKEDIAATICNVSVEKVEFTSPIQLPHIEDPIANDQFISRFRTSIRSTWIKLVRATARSLKLYMDGFIPLVKSKDFDNPKTRTELKAKDFRSLTRDDLDRAELFLIRRAQRQSMPEEYAALQAGKQILNKELQQLRVFMDDQGVIRINSRVKLCQSVYPQRFCPFLPRENPYTRIYLYHVHYEYQHIHLETQIGAVRSRVWIPAVRVALKSVQHKCNYCAFLRARPYAPLMAPLPDCRTDPTQFPFQTTGLDCAGPFDVYIHNRPKKIWILIFTCALTRFIQLHILESMHSSRVLEAIATLVATNGPVQTFISDRGPNFKGASRFIREEWERTKSDLADVHGQIAPELAEKYRVDWKLLPAHSPWMGGFYERLIKEVKRSIAKTLCQKKLTKIELNIALQDACHRINCRPLTHVPVDADDADVLTPHHLARNRPGWPYLPSFITLPSPSNPKDDRRIFRRGRLVADEMMKKFVDGYLVVLAKRTKWFTDNTAPLKINDLVLLIEPNSTRKEWKRGKVLKIYKSGDRRGRVADVLVNGKTGMKVKKARSVQRLAKLEIQTRNEDD